MSLSEMTEELMLVRSVDGERCLSHSLEFSKAVVAWWAVSDCPSFAINSELRRVDINQHPVFSLDLHRNRKDAYYFKRPLIEIGVDPFAHVGRIDEPILQRDDVFLNCVRDPNVEVASIALSRTIQRADLCILESEMCQLYTKVDNTYQKIVSKHKILQTCQSMADRGA